MGTFYFVLSHLFYAVGINVAAVAELLRLIERLEEIHTKVKVMIISPHLSTTIPNSVSRGCIIHLNSCFDASSS